MRWIYLSPHLDDAVLSCGGVIWQQVQAGHAVQIYTLCAGDPPPGPLPPLAAQMHARWQTGTQAPAARRAEDAAACRAVGAAHRHADLPDCIYRRLPDGSPLIHANDNLWVSRLDQRSAADLSAAARWLATNLPARCRLVAPLTIGRHIDHHLTRAAAESLGLNLWYYADYPYAARHNVDVRAFVGPGWQRRPQPLAPAALQAWQNGIACYTSQISTFWSSLGEMRAAIEHYAQGGGSALWTRRARRA